jgi:type IV pilus assembly protein PilB
MDFKDRVVDILRESGVVSSDDLDKAAAFCRTNGGSLKNALLRLGLINEKVLLQLLSKDFGIPPVELSRFHIAPEMAQILPAAIASKYSLVPVGKIGNTLTVAVSDPLNIFMFDDMKQLTGLTVNPVLASESDIEEAFTKLYQVSAEEEITSLIEQAEEGDIEVLHHGGRVEEDVKLGEVQEGPVIKVTNYIMKSGVEKGVSDILIEPGETRMRVRFRIDGVLREQESPPFSMLFLIISRIKVMADLNIAEHRLPQDGRFRLKISGRDIDFRVSVVPTALGEKVTIRILDKGNAALDIDSMGYELDVVAKLKEVASRPNGMILTCGPTGQGKTTTLYSVLKYVDSPEKNIVTVEDPIEFELKGLNQVQVNPEVEMTFSAALRSILRQDPDIIMIGEIRDYETVDIAIKAALTGHLVLSTVHTTTACGTITRFVNMGVEPFLMASSLLAIIAQRLLRRLCEKCKEKTVLDDATCHDLGVDNGFECYKPAGCAYCNGTGYKGRVAICELVIMTKEMKEAIANNAAEIALRDIARREGCRSIREDALIKLQKGITSADEVIKVTVVD